MKKIIFSAAVLTAAMASAQTTGIGTTAPNAATQLHVVKTETASNSGNSFGIQTDLTTAAQGSVRGVSNTVNYTASAGTGTAMGVYSLLNDASTTAHTSYGAYFGNTVSVGKTNTDAFTHGLWSDVTINPASGSINTPFAYGGQATARAVASTGDITLSSLRGYSGYAIPTAASGRTVTMDDLYGAHLTARPTVNGGTISLKNLYGVSAQFDDSGSSGTLSITGDAAALRASVSLGNSTAKNIKNLYGVLVNYAPGNAGNSINNAYGVYISPVSGSANPYNLYSAGENTRNYFAGDVTVGNYGSLKTLHTNGYVSVKGKVLIDSGSGDDSYSYTPHEISSTFSPHHATMVIKSGENNVNDDSEILLSSNLITVEALSGSGNDIVIADTNGTLSKQTVSTLTGWATDPSTGNISRTGKVAINTATAPVEMLEVGGNVKANKFIASTGTFPDYVFQNYYTGTASKLNPFYKFTSLNETEKFIKENGHLPGFESAAEVVKKGEFNVSDTSLKSVEKIEELYLHMIELEKRVQQLEKENQQLKANK